MKKNKNTLLTILLVLLVACGHKDDPKIKTYLTGTWRCDETNLLTGTLRTYLVDLDPDQKDTTQYFISNFHNVDNQDGVKAKVTDRKLKIFDAQTIGFSSTILKSGTGVVSDDAKSIVLEYKIYDATNDFDVHAVYTRK